MNVLIACEYSGTVRNSFTEKGHNATSCDILPTESKGNHYQGDILDILDQGWDLMIAHPPCTYLSNAGIGWFNEEKYREKAVKRKELRLKGFDFFMKLANASIEKICIENPVGYVNSHYRKPDQVIHPWYFGDNYKKRTCLWLKNLPKLKYNLSKMKEPEPLAYYKTGKSKGKPIHWSSYMMFREDRAKIRSKTFQGIADAMAEQWRNE